MRVLFWLYAVQSIVLVTATRSTHERCETRLGFSSVPKIPSSTITVNVPLTISKKICSTQLKTITPSSIVSHVTATKTLTTITTNPQITDIVLSFFTQYVNITKTATSFITLTAFTTTSTVFTPTSTVPTPAGFTPISQAPGYVPKRNKRNIFNNRGPSKKNFSMSRRNESTIYSPEVYPISVKCYKFIEFIVTTKTINPTNCISTKFTTPPPRTITKTSTTTATVTKTSFVPDATSIITISSTVTTFTTTTKTAISIVTSTDTTTLIAPSATFYAACANNNIVSRANGGVKIFDVGYNLHGYLANNPVTLKVPSAYDCCVACQQATNCIGSSFFVDQANQKFCVVILGVKCDPKDSQFTDFQTDPVPRGSPFSISNGPCGFVKNDGRVVFE